MVLHSERKADKIDLVQDLYINQLKAYKPAPQVCSGPRPNSESYQSSQPTIHPPKSPFQANHQTADAASAVRSYKAPASPKAPTLPTDLASELSKFDAQEPSFASPAAKKATSTDGAESADEYLTFLEKDMPKADAHH